MPPRARLPRARLNLTAKEKAALFKRAAIVGAPLTVILSAGQARLVATTHLREGIWGGANLRARHHANDASYH